MAEQNAKSVEIPLGDDGEPLMVVSRHVVLMRPHLFKLCDDFLLEGGQPPPEVLEEMSEFPDGERELIYDAASGNRAWLESIGGRSTGSGYIFLSQEGVLVDTAGTRLRVPPGVWRIRPQAAHLQGGALTVAFYPFRHVC
jgi:hypothetical protein